MVAKLLHFHYTSIEAKANRRHGRSSTTNLDSILHESVGCILAQLCHTGMLWTSIGQPLVLIVYLCDTSPTTPDGRAGQAPNVAWACSNDRILELNLGKLRYYYRDYLVQDDGGVVKRHEEPGFPLVNQSSSIDFMGQSVLRLDGYDTRLCLYHSQNAPCP